MILNGILEGCWLTPDPLGGDITNPQSLNRYAYVLNNPTTLVDPFGLQPFNIGNCLFDTINASVNGVSQGSYTIFDGCLQTYQPWLYNPPGSYTGGGGGGGTATPPPKATPPPLLGGTNHSGTTVCGGSSVFSAVGPNQALGPGSLSPSIQGHQAGGVAINPAIFGLEVGAKGTTAATIYYAHISAIVPQNVKLNGYPGPPYHVTDIGDRNILNGVPYRFDLYGAPYGPPTQQQAIKFGVQPTPAYIVVGSPNFACPAGYTKF